MSNDPSLPTYRRVAILSSVAEELRHDERLVVCRRDPEGKLWIVAGVTVLPKGVRISCDDDDEKEPWQ